MAYRERPDRGGQWIFDNHKIIRRYLRRWFAIDVITTMPIDAILVVLEASGAITIDGGDTQFTRLVRMLRLLKLMRIVRASRIFKRWEAYLSPFAAHHNPRAMIPPCGGPPRAARRRTGATTSTTGTSLAPHLLRGCTRAHGGSCDMPAANFYAGCIEFFMPCPQMAH